MKYIDIHSHVLPCMDDGAKSLEQSIRMLEIAEHEGIGTIITTPHNMPGKGCPSKKEVYRAVKHLQQAAVENGLSVRLLPGTEYFVREEVIELFEREEAVTIGNTDCVLIEFDPYVEKSYILRSVEEILGCGYTPIIAHVERYRCLNEKKFTTIAELRSIGTLIQVNCSTITGDSGKQMQRPVKDMLKSGLVDFIGTDAHSDGRRAPRMSECADYLYKKFGKEYAEELIFAKRLKPHVIERY